MPNQHVTFLSKLTEESGKTLKRKRQVITLCSRLSHNKQEYFLISLFLFFQLSFRQSGRFRETRKNSGAKKGERGLVRGVIELHDKDLTIELTDHQHSYNLRHWRYLASTTRCRLHSEFPYKVSFLCCVTSKNSHILSLGCLWF